MTQDLPFLKRGERLPVDVLGRDVHGTQVRLGDVLAEHDKVLLYFYPFDAREGTPESWRRIEERTADIERRGATVIGVRGPAEATRGADLEGLTFPVIEDHNYALGQAVGVLGGRDGDDVESTDVPRGLVLLDHDGKVIEAVRGDDEDALKAVLGRL